MKRAHIKEKWKLTFPKMICARVWLIWFTFCGGECTWEINKTNIYKINEKRGNAYVWILFFISSWVDNCLIKIKILIAMLRDYILELNDRSSYIQSLFSLEKYSHWLLSLYW
jgi:hypothetical protein